MHTIFLTTTSRSLLDDPDWHYASLPSGFVVLAGFARASLRFLRASMRALSAATRWSASSLSPVSSAHPSSQDMGGRGNVLCPSLFI